MRHSSLQFPATLVLLAWAATAHADLTLADFSQSFDMARAKTTNATATPAKNALRVSTQQKPGWPGVTILPPDRKWNLSEFEFVEVSIQNLGASPVTVFCRVDNPGADGAKNCCNGSIQLAPSKSGLLRVHLSRKSDIGPKLFGMRGYPPGFDPNGTLDPSNITQVLLFVHQPASEHAFQINTIRAIGNFQQPKVTPENFFPFIDEFGQYIHCDWPGKVHSAAELAARLDQEREQLAKFPGPNNWNKWGGWNAGPSLDAKGFFRVQKVDAKWWLVDPDGKLFFSHGVDCVRMLDITPVEGRQSWFKDFPGDKPQFQQFLVPGAYALHGHYAGQRPRSFGFAAANLYRKYGQNWRDAASQFAHQRLRSWGLNTIGNWSDRALCAMQQTAYVCTLGSARVMIEGSQGYWGKFPDVFDPQWITQTQQSIARGAGRTGSDPWCIGYFVDNEMSWGDELSLAIGALASPANQTAKKVLVKDLQAKYTTIQKLNQAWSTRHDSWDALLQSKTPPDKQLAREDLVAFYDKAARQYFKVIKESVHAAAPGRLYLGCRFAWANPVAVRAAAAYCDVVSFNLYQRSLADFKLPPDVDVPLIIGEFHFGALDRGMFHTGLVPTANQAERAAAYKQYVKSCLQHPAFVGCHWFQWQDEPTTGRVYDEENYQIGLVDSLDTPYEETIRAVREVGYALYP